MSASGIATFDSTLQTTHIWLDEIMDELGWDDRQKAYHALRAVLHALRDRLTIDAAANLAAQLPLLIRGVFYDGWRPSATPVRERTQDQFLVHITEAFLFDPSAHSEDIARAVFGVIADHVTEGEVEKVKGMMPAGIRDLWP